MLQPSIVLSKVSKSFPIYQSQRDRMAAFFLGHRWKKRPVFTALREIDLTIYSGETVGLLGINGAGKSTLLQIIAGTLEATSGSVTVNGKIAALLELGSGFNPGWTGRQNAEFQCRISGVAAADLPARLKEIEGFADVGEFFDQPMRTYSSGMFMRVAFAAAITVDPDILIVDEALAVGDARFQNKCFKRFSEFQKAGKTILFVTHSAELIANYCSRGVVLDNHAIVFDGPPKEAIDRFTQVMYSTQGSNNHPIAIQNSSFSVKTERPSYFDSPDATDQLYQRDFYNKDEHRYGQGSIKIIDAVLLRDGVIHKGLWQSGDNLTLAIRARASAPVPCATPGFVIKTIDGIRIYGTAGPMQHIEPLAVGPETDIFWTISFDLILYAGHYFMDISACNYENGEYLIHDIRHSSVHIMVSSSNQFNGLVDLNAKIVTLPT
jgi:lipopolysaccharide transport system ATP-binding protein